MNNYEEVPFSSLVGQTISKIQGGEGEDELNLEMSNGDRYRMYHGQNCCESVYIEEIHGDLNDIIGEEILRAEELTPDLPRLNKYDERYTWTFYVIETNSSYATIRWYGSSNGYYSTEVSFIKILE
jgi:hypothetical protein